MLSPMYTFSAHNNRLALSALHDGLEALHCSSDGPNMGPLGGPLPGKSEGHGDSGFIGNDKLRLCKAVPNLYAELRRSVLGVRVPGDIHQTQHLTARWLSNFTDTTTISRFRAYF